MAATRPGDRVTDYPEPQNHGPMPAYGFFVRHVEGLEMRNIEVSYDRPDVRPPFVIEHVKDAALSNVSAQGHEGAPKFILRNVEDFRAHRVRGVADVERAKVGDEEKL